LFTFAEYTPWCYKILNGYGHIEDQILATRRPSRGRPMTKPWSAHDQAVVTP